MINIDSIHIKSDRGIVPTECNKINIIIGVNNSGKTTFLNGLHKDIRQLHPGFPENGWTYGFKERFQNSQKRRNEIFPAFGNFDKFMNFDQISKNLFGFDKNNVGWNQSVYDYLSDINSSEVIEAESYSIKLVADTRNQVNLFSFLNSQLVVFESCSKRLSVPLQTTIEYLAGDGSPNDIVFHYFKNAELFTVIQKNIEDVFGIKIGFDNTQQGVKYIRQIIEDIDSTITDPFLLLEEWNSKSMPLSTTIGHGIKAYLKLAFSILHPKSQIVFIDEPELFLHPPQRRSLGKLLAKLAIDNDKQLFIATHDPEFLRGIISVGYTHLNLLQLTTNRRINKIDSSSLESIINKKTSKLLNERILNSFFYKKTILCENENDRFFYEEAAATYSWEKFHDVNFIGLNGLTDVLSFFIGLKGISLSVALIVDIDALFSEELANIGDVRENLQELKSVFDERGIRKEKGNENYLNFKKNGIEYFESQDKARHLLSQALEYLKSNNIYLVPVGEFESWYRVEKNDIQTAVARIVESENETLKEFLDDVISTTSAQPLLLAARRRSY